MKLKKSTRIEKEVLQFRNIIWPVQIASATVKLRNVT